MAPRGFVTHTHTLLDNKEPIKLLTPEEERKQERPMKHLWARQRTAQAGQLERRTVFNFVPGLPSKRNARNPKRVTGTHRPKSARGGRKTEGWERFREETDREREQRDRNGKEKKRKEGRQRKMWCGKRKKKMKKNKRKGNAGERKKQRKVGLANEGK